MDNSQTYRSHPWRPILGFETTEVVPLPEQLVSNELVNPCYVSSGMSTEPIRYPNLVTGFERNPQHAARTALNTRYTPTEWKNANAALSCEADCNLKQSENFLLDANRLLKHHYSPIGGQTASGFRIGERITDTKFMSQELNDELGKLINEMNVLSDAKRDLMKSIQVICLLQRQFGMLSDTLLQDLETPLHIAQECLYHREGRYGVDKTHDYAEKSLLKEIDNIRDAQSKLNALLDKVCKIKI